MSRRDPWVPIGLIAFFALLIVALFGERLAPHETFYFVVEHGRDPRPYDPGLVFPFGSDVLGRDLLSLVLAGAGTTLLIVVLSGLARVAAGLALAAVAGWWPAARIASDSLAELVAAVPATLVALLVVKVFVRGDTTFLVFVGAILITGWAGPYRIIRSELDRLAHTAFTDSATALGVGRLRVFARHHLPHLVPMISVNAAQQSVASLVALAELGVLGVLVGASRLISVEESLTVVRTGPANSAQIADPPEWGGLLANARGIESLWTTRWLFLVPGIAFAIAAVAIAAIGVALARRYGRRNLFDDLRGRGAAAFVAACALLFVASALVPERHAAAREWASAARSAVAETDDASKVFADAGLRPVAQTFALEREVSGIRKAAPAAARVGSVEIRESPEGPVDLRPFVYAGSGGGRVEAEVAFVSWGISPSDHPPRAVGIFSAPDFGRAVEDWPDDYGAVDVRGRIAVLLRFSGIQTGRGGAVVPDVGTMIGAAVKRGAAAVIVVDPALSAYPRLSTNLRANPYQRIESAEPVERLDGTPVVVLSLAAVDRLLRPAGVVPSEIYAPLRTVSGPFTLAVTPAWLDSVGPYAKRSAARLLPMRGRVEVPLERARATVRTVVGELGSAAADVPRVVVWAVAHHSSAGDRESVDVAAAVARAFGRGDVPVIVVAFDPSVDPAGNARQVAAALKDRRIGLIVVFDDLVGAALRFRTPHGDLIPMFDTYAARSGAPHVITRTTVNPNNEAWVWPGSPPFIDHKAVLVTGDGAPGDLRPHAAALVGYLIGRLALGAEELPR